MLIKENPERRSVRKMRRVEERLHIIVTKRGACMRAIHTDSLSIPIRRVRINGGPFTREDWVPRLDPKNRTATGVSIQQGFTKDEIYALCGLVRRETTDAQENVWPPILGLFKAVVVTLTYLRRNRVQAELAETFGVSQPTISRAISGLTPVLGRVLADYVPVAEDLDPRTGYIVDGTLLPCW